jgi:L,D-transpeptidase ErfK/SrfK
MERRMWASQRRPPTHRGRAAAALCGAAGTLLAGCTAVRWTQGHLPRTRLEFTEETFARKPVPAYRIPTPKRGAPAGAIIGSLHTYRVRQGDTLLDVARYYDLGYNEIVEANPGVDPWLPPVGTNVLLSTSWILPCCTYEGIVVNIPEMRLYFYRRDPADPAHTTVYTYPVGLGRDDWRTPRGRFRVRGKTVNPRWNIPASIRREHVEERNDARTSIPGGDPDNPLGKYRLELTHSLYSIHGTNVPWGTGMQVSHGCVRLYPEDIERLFPLVAVGTPVEFTYQPVKAARRDGAVYVEVHRDIYRYAPSLQRAAHTALGRADLGSGVDPARLKAALKDAAGVPRRVSGDVDARRAGAPGPGTSGLSRPARAATPAGPPPQETTPASFQRAISSQVQPSSSSTSSVCAPASCAGRCTSGGAPPNCTGFAHTRTGPVGVDDSSR